MPAGWREDYCHLDLGVYMTDVYCRGWGLHRQPDRSRIGLCLKEEDWIIIYMRKQP